MRWIKQNYSCRETELPTSAEAPGVGIESVGERRGAPTLPAARMRARGDAGEGCSKRQGRAGARGAQRRLPTWESTERENGVFRDSRHASKCLLVIPPGRQQPPPAGELDCTGTPGTSALTLDDVTGYLFQYGFHSHAAIPFLSLPANTAAPLKRKGLTFQFRKVCAYACIKIVTFWWFF